jgi:hypothetical protein
MRRYSHNRKECCSIVSAKVLKTSVMRSRRLIFRLVQLKPRMKDTGFLLWPTPNASEAVRAPGPGCNQINLTSMAKRGDIGFWRTPSGNVIEAKSTVQKLTGRTPSDPQVGLADQVKFVSMWPTPNVPNGGRTLHHVEDFRGTIAYHNGKKVQVGLEAAVKMWPTIRASDGEHGGPNQRDSKGNLGLPAAVTIYPQEKEYGFLNPEWVEAMVGLPLGWTDLSVCEITRENQNKWPAFMGQEQYEWEPPRTCEKIPNRAKRLKALGNICIPQQVYPIFAGIVEVERMKTYG